MPRLIIEPHPGEVHLENQQIAFVCDEGKRVDLERNEVGDTWVQVHPSIPDELPPIWGKKVLLMMAIAADNVAFAGALDGDYVEEGILILGRLGTVQVRARVDTHVHQQSGALYQTIRVRLFPGSPEAQPVAPLLAILRRWYDELRAGRKNTLVKSPVVIAQQFAQPMAMTLHIEPAWSASSMLGQTEAAAQVGGNAYYTSPSGGLLAIRLDDQSRAVWVSNHLPLSLSSMWDGLPVRRFYLRGSSPFAQAGNYSRQYEHVAGNGYFAGRVEHGGEVQAELVLEPGYTLGGANDTMFVLRRLIDWFDQLCAGCIDDLELAQ